MGLLSQRAVGPDVPHLVAEVALPGVGSSGAGVGGAVDGIDAVGAGGGVKDLVGGLPLVGYLRSALVLCTL